MSKRSEEAAMKAVPIYPPEIYADMDEYIEVESERNLHRAFLRKGYEQAEKDLADVAAFSSGPDGFYYGKGYQQGKKDAEKDTIDKIRVQVKQWMPEKDGEEHTYWERLAFNSVLHLLEEMEEK